MLRIFDKKSAYSNFWGGVDDQVQYFFLLLFFWFPLRNVLTFIAIKNTG